MIKLKAKNDTERRVLDYLSSNASETLTEKINAGKKTIAGAMSYAKDEAQKLAKGAGYICIEDATVFGWIIHFFEEDDIAEPKATTTAMKKKGAAPIPKKKVVKKTPVKEDPQMTMFSALFGGDQ